MALEPTIRGFGGRPSTTSLPVNVGIAPTAFDDLHRRYFDDLRSFLQRRLRDRELAEDIAQEAFLRAYRARAAFDSERPIWPWLLTIARNLMLNAIRDQNRRRAGVQTTGDWDNIVGSGDAHPELDPEEIYLSSQHRRAIKASLTAMSTRQRRVLLGRALEGLSYNELAKGEGLSVVAVKSLLKRARQRFRFAYDSMTESRLPGVVLLVSKLLTRTRYHAHRLRAYIDDGISHLQSSTAASPFLPTVSALTVAGAILLGGFGSAPSPAPGNAVHPSSAMSEFTTSLERPRDFQIGSSPRSLDEGRAEDKSPHAARVSITKSVDKSQNDRRTLRVVTEDDPPKNGGSHGTDTGVELPCEATPVNRTVCDEIDRAIL